MCADHAPTGGGVTRRTLGALMVKAENSQVKGKDEASYPLYPLCRLTLKSLSHRGYAEHRVHAVQERIRFDKRISEGAEN